MWRYGTLDGSDVVEGGPCSRFEVGRPRAWRWLLRTTTQDNSLLSPRMSPAPTVRPSLPSVIEVNPSRDVLSTLNDLLPSGTQSSLPACASERSSGTCLTILYDLRTEHDLSTQAALIQASLRVQLAQTRARIVDLQASLSSGGSEGRVQVIQSLISVLPSSHSHLASATAELNIFSGLTCRNCSSKRLGSRRRVSRARPSSSPSPGTSRLSTSARRTLPPPSLYCVVWKV